jgi:hypothetical protein
MLELNNGKIKVPDSWAELNSSQFAQVASFIFLYLTGQVDLPMFRLLVFKCLTGYKRSRKRYSKDEQERINTNLYILSEKITFAIRPEYDQNEVYNLLSPGLQELLKTHFPIEIFDAKYREELDRVISLLVYHAAINYDISFNPLPVIRIGKKVFYGPVFTLDKRRVLSTNLTVGEYFDAREYLVLFEKTNDAAYLDNIVSIFYRPDRNSYNTFEAQQNAKLVAGANVTEKFGVWLLFCSWQYYFTTHPYYSLLFTGNDYTPDKINLGAGESIYNLSTEGYGDLKNVMQMNICDYFNIKIKGLKGSIQSLRDMGKKDYEIAKVMNLPVSVVSKF